MSFKLFADKARQEKMDKAYAAGFDPDAPTAQDADTDFDPIRNIEIDADPGMPRRMSWKMDW